MMMLPGDLRHGPDLKSSFVLQRRGAWCRSDCICCFSWIDDGIVSCSGSGFRRFLSFLLLRLLHDAAMLFGAVAGTVKGSFKIMSFIEDYSVV